MCIISFNQLQTISHKIERGQSIVLTGGCFDLLHTAHVRILEKCREYGDILVVLISSDLRVRQRKGLNRPIIPEGQRAFMVGSIKCVDYAVIAPNPDSTLNSPTVRVIHKLKPDVFVTTDIRMDQYKNELEYNGIKAVRITPIAITNTTTTGIIQRIVKRYKTE